MSPCRKNGRKVVASGRPPFADSLTHGCLEAVYPRQCHGGNLNFHRGIFVSLSSWQFKIPQHRTCLGRPVEVFADQSLKCDHVQLPFVLQGRLCPGPSAIQPACNPPSSKPANIVSQPVSTPDSEPSKPAGQPM